MLKYILFPSQLRSVLLLVFLEAPMVLVNVSCPRVLTSIKEMDRVQKLSYQYARLRVEVRDGDDELSLTLR